MASDEQIRELEEKYEGYTVYDRDGDKIGKVDDLFVDEDDREEYIGVKMGLFGFSGTTLIPSEMARIDEQDKSITVSETKDRVKDAPTYKNDEDIDAGFEDRIRDFYGLQRQEASAGRGSYAAAGDGSRMMEGTPEETRGGGTDREDLGGQGEYVGEREEDRAGLGERRGQDAPRGGDDREEHRERGEGGQGEEGFLSRGEQRGDREERGEREAPSGDMERREPESRGGGDAGEVPVRRDTDEGLDRERGGQEVESSHGEGGYGETPAGHSDEEFERQEGGERTRVRRRSRSQERSFEQEEEEERFSL